MIGWAEEANDEFQRREQEALDELEAEEAMRQFTIDPRFVAWLSVHQEKVERACGEITEALSEKNYALLEELGRVLSNAAGRCVAGPLDTEESAS